MPICWCPSGMTNNVATTDSSAITITSSNTTSSDSWHIFAAQFYALNVALQAWTTWAVQGQAIVNGHDVQAAEQRERQRMVDAGLAQRRARRLLVQHLTPEQRRTYEAHAYFDVDINGKTYRIRQGTHGNVRLLERAKACPPIFATIPAEQPLVEKVSFCAQPNGVPAEDAMLAQKLMLETDERKFLEIANWTDLATGRLMDKRALLVAP